MAHLQRLKDVRRHVISVRLPADLFHDQPGNTVIDIAVLEGFSNRLGEHQAIARARAGDGMTILVAETYRMLGHAQHDAQRYVPDHELAEWKDHDPIQSFADYLIEFGFESDSTLDQIRAEVALELDAAADEVLSEGYPAAEEARTRVYGDPTLDAQVPWSRGVVPGYEGMTSGKRGRPAAGLEGA